MRCLWPLTLTLMLRPVALALMLLCVSVLPSPQARPAQEASAQTAAGGRVLGAARGQVAWLDLIAPRPRPLTQIARPAYPADVAGAPGVPFAVASVVEAMAGSNGALGSDLLQIDLSSGSSTMLLTRASDAESLDLPAIWSDGSGVLYQRSDLKSAIPMPGQAQPQFLSRIEQVDPEGRFVTPLLSDARYPGPAPDGSHLAFVRSTDQGAAIFIHSIADSTDAPLVPPGKFLALAYPRFSPDGTRVAFVAIAMAPALGHSTLSDGFFSVRSALAHGFPWEAWIVNADGSGLRQIEDLIDDDPSVAWSPDGTQLLVYGGWGSFVVDTASGEYTSLSYIAGYGSIAWLPD